MNSQDSILSFSIPPAFSLSILNPVPSTNTNPEEYKYKKNCKICAISLKATKLHSRHRLRQCKFCYDAVCDPCSALRLPHPSIHSEQRICISCLNSAITQSLKSAIDKQVSSKRRESLTLLIKDKQEIFKIQKRVEELMNLCDAKQGELQEKKREIEKLKKEIVKDSSFCCENKEYIGLKMELEKEDRVLQELEENIEKNFRVLEECREKSGWLDCQIKEEMENARVRARVQVKSCKAIQEESVENLSTQISFLHGLANTYKHDIEKTKIVEVKNKEKCFIL